MGNIISLLMKDDKSLIITESTKLYQHEKLIDKIKIYIPSTYGEYDLTQFTAVLQYVTQDGTVRTASLTREPDLYQDIYMIFDVPIDTDITTYAGDVELQVTLTWVDVANDHTYVLNTGTQTITVLSLKDYFAFVPDASLSVINNAIAQLQTQIDELEAIAATYDNEKADNIVLDDVNHKMFLTSNGAAIGDEIDTTLI